MVEKMFSEYETIYVCERANVSIFTEYNNRLKTNIVASIYIFNKPILCFSFSIQFLKIALFPPFCKTWKI